MNFHTKILLFIGCACAFSCTSPSGNTPESEIATTNEPSSSIETSDTKKSILIFGNSLTAGYGLEADESFPAVLQQRMDSLGLPYAIINAGVSGETTATGLSRIDWVLENQEVDIFILELGANDGLRGLPVAQTQKNLERMIAKVKAAYPAASIILAGMMVPPSMGSDYSQQYSKIYPEIAQQQRIFLIPFLLKDVGGIASLNQNDGIHPNVAGARIMADNVWDVLEPLLK